MDTGKEVISALLYFISPFLVIIPWYSVDWSAVGLGNEAVLIGNTLVIAVMLLAAYIIPTRYYFKDMKIKDPVREGLLLGLLFSVTFAVGMSVLQYLTSNAVYISDWYTTLSLAMTPAVTVVAAIDSKPKRRKLFGIF
jgi:hypothetical protein